MSKLSVEKLDRSRPFGQVYGDTEHKIHFTQRAMGIEAWPYDAHGVLIEDALNEAQSEKLAERRAKAAQSAAQPEPPAPEPEEDEPDAPLPPKTDEGEEVNLEMWLRGEIRYKPHELQREGKRRFGVNKPKPRDLALFLIEDPKGPKLVPRGEVSREILPPLDA